MTNENVLYDNSELSLAAYASLSIGDTLPQKQFLKDVGMTDTQAEQFAARWPDVVNQYTSPVTGLSVTVFRNGSEVNVAIRGTETSSVVDFFTDLYNDLVIGIGQTPIQYAELKIIYESFKSSGAIQATDNVTVSGHSLGGFLAQLLAVDYASDFDHAYTYNAPGIDGVPLDLFGIIPDSITTAGITNIRGDGFSLIATVGTSLGSVSDVQIENSLLATGDHTITKLTHSLAVFNILNQLDATLTVEQYNSIFSASSNVENATLENMVSDIHNLFLNAPLIINTDVHEELFAGIQIIKTELYVAPNISNTELKFNYQGLSITSLTTATPNGGVVSHSAETIKQAAQTSIAHRYAMLELNPFVITGNETIYNDHNLNSELNLYDPSTGTGMTDEYITDRSAFLY